MKDKTIKKMTKAGMVWGFTRGSRRYFAVSSCLAILMAASELVNPKIISFTVDSIIGDLPISTLGIIRSAAEAVGGIGWLRQNLWAVAVAVTVLALFSALCGCAYRICNTYGAEKLVEGIRNRIFRHIGRLPFAWHTQNKTGDIIQRCTSDVETIKRLMSDRLSSLLRIGLLIILSIIFMAGMNVPLTLIAVVSMGGFLTYSVIMRKKIGGAFQEYDEREGVLSTVVQENLTGVRVVRAFGRERYERDKFRQMNEDYAAFGLRFGRIIARFFCLTDAIASIQSAIILVTGTVMCVRGHLTSGELLAFITYNAMLSGPVRQLGRIIGDIGRAGVSVDRIYYIMVSRPEPEETEKTPAPMTGDVVFEDVTFSYEPEQELLSHVSFTARAGTTLGILGSTGSGKSTLMYLLDRLYDLPEGCGRITVGGVDIRDMPARYVRSQVGLVLQEPYLFSRTLRENITLARPDYTPAELERAVEDACLTETVAGFADGLETFVGERGTTLSGGQKQRAAIARMLMQNAPILVFDDSLSAVDSQTDAKIRRALRRRQEKATTIIISHRITTLMHADRILVLDHGRRAEFGSHEELLARNGLYRKIYDIQRSSAEDWEEVTGS